MPFSAFWGSQSMENRQLKLPIGHYHISALPHPKLSQAHARMLKGWKWLRNDRKTARNHAKKILVKQGKDIGSSVKNQENIKWKQRPVIFAKNGRCNSDQNGRVGISLEFLARIFSLEISLHLMYFISEITYTPLKSQMVPRPLSWPSFYILPQSNSFGKCLKKGEGEKGIKCKQSQ